MKKLLKAMITFALMLCILSTGVFAEEDSSNTPKGISARHILMTGSCRYICI